MNGVRELVHEDVVDVVVRVPRVTENVVVQDDRAVTPDPG
jgi:hypothetical protein